MKGVILCGGKGTRLAPLTHTTNKHLLAVYNRAMVTYPLSTLLSLGIDDILIVTGGEHIGAFADVLGDGNEYGAKLTYKVQSEAGGIAQALGLARSFVGSDDVVAILGDNIFDNKKLSQTIQDGQNLKGDSWIVVKEVESPNRFGVVDFDSNGEARKIYEKPAIPPSKYAVTGIYKYTPDVFDIISSLEPSGRGELEITDVNNAYLMDYRCSVRKYDGFWSDAGTFDSLFNSAEWVKQQNVLI